MITKNFLVSFSIILLCTFFTGCNKLNSNIPSSNSSSKISSASNSSLKNDVSVVKNSIYGNYNNETMGQAVQKIMKAPSWKSFIGTDGNRYVQVEGTISFNNTPTYSILQFIIVRENTYMIHALSVDGVIQNQSSIDQFLQMAYSN